MMWEMESARQLMLAHERFDRIPEPEPTPGECLQCHKECEKDIIPQLCPRCLKIYNKPRDESWYGFNWERVVVGNYVQMVPGNIRW